MRRMTVLALVAVIALFGAACGGDDDDAADDVEATDDGGDDGAATDDSGGDDEGGDDGGDGGDLSAVISGMGGCTGAAAAVSASILSGFDPSAAEQLEENREFFDDFATSVPDDIKDDVELLADYLEAYSQVMGDYSPEDYTDPETAQQIGEEFEALEEEYPSADMTAANDSISAWFTEECPALEGSGG